VSRSLRVHELLDLVLDPGSFRSWDSVPVRVPTTPAYEDELAAARTRTGLQTTKIAAAVAAHKAAGLPYLVYLRHPTTGGVLASWGSLGHVTVAEPRALIGFLGPRVYEALYGQSFPRGVQVSENLYDHGLVDAVLPPAEVADITDRVLNVLLAPREGLPAPPELPYEAVPDVSA
jgi:acyl-CoA carboxylase subunit beta